MGKGPQSCVLTKIQAFAQDVKVMAVTRSPVETPQLQWLRLR
jgi:hypothetical protein